MKSNYGEENLNSLKDFPQFIKIQKNHISSDDIFIPKGTVQSGQCCAGTRTIHAFGVTRIHK